MMWNFFRGRNRLDQAAARMRAEHEWFLNRAMTLSLPYPRIPTRPVRDGGFSAMMARPDGRPRADRWWEIALDRVER